MPLNENDPEVKDTKEHLELLYKRKGIIEHKRRVHRQKFQEIQTLLAKDEAEFNQTVGAISATEELLSKFRDNTNDS
jgi:hypothetical protein